LGLGYDMDMIRVIMQGLGGGTCSWESYDSRSRSNNLRAKSLAGRYENNFHKYFILQ
jgi:hypothetical protein